MVRVRTLGNGSVETNRASITPKSELLFALGVYLCVRAGQPILRDAAARLLWPDSELVESRHSLRQLVYRLRLADVPVESQGISILVAADKVEWDAGAVLAARWCTDVNEEELAATGEFLEHYSPDFSEEFNEWLEQMRAQMRAQRLRAGQRQIALARREGRWSDLHRIASIVLRFDPLNEEATLSRAESAAMSGSKAFALDLLDEYIQDLGSHASSIGLPARVLRRRISEQSSEWVARAPGEVALVGRSIELARLTTALNEAKRTAGGALLLHGAPGIGKSRIASEARRVAELEGYRCTFVRASSSDAGRPLALAVRLAAAILEAPGAAGTTPTAYGLLTRLTTPGPPTSTIDALSSGPATTDALAWAFTEAVSAISAESPLLILLDDLHHADGLSQQILDRIASTASGLRMLLIATRRTGRVHDSSALSSFQNFVPVQISPLSAVSAEELVDQLERIAAPGRNAVDKSAVVRTAGGNPLFLRELTTHQQNGGTLEMPPEGLMQTIAHRFAELSIDEVRVLRRIEMLGPLATHSRIRSLEQTSKPNLSATIESLETQGIICASPRGTIALHECWQQSVRSSTGAAHLAMLALECAEMLLADDPSGDILESYWRAAELFSAAGDRTRARDTYANAGTDLLRRGATRSAIVAFDRSLQNSTTPVERLQGSVLFAGALHLDGDFSRAYEACRVALQASPAATPRASSSRAMLLALKADSALLGGVRDAAAQADAIEALADGLLDDTVCQRACFYVLRSVLADATSARVQLVLAASRRAAARSGISPYGALCELVAAAEQGSPGEARRADELVASLPTAELPPSVESLMLRFRAINLRWLGDFDRAVDLLLRAREVALATGGVSELHASAQNLAFLYLDIGDVASARAWLVTSSEGEPVVSGSQRDRSIRHATGRLRIAEGDFEGCLEHYADTASDIALDPLVRRRSVDRGCLAVAAARTGRRAFAIELVEELEALLRTEQPCAHFDFVLDCVLNAREALGDAVESVRLGVEYLNRRLRTFDRPLVPALLAVRSLAPAE